MAASFQDLCKAFMDEALSWDPPLATQLGWHKYDRQLRDLSRGVVDKQIMRCSQWIEEFKRVPDDGLTPDELLDRDLAIHLLRLWHYELRDLRMYERVCSAAPDVGNALFFLFVRESLPLNERLEAIVSRLESVPQFLEKARSVLRTPYRVWNEEAFEAGSAIPGFLTSIEDHVRKKVQSAERLARLSTAIAKAKEAVEQHNAWLRDRVIPTARASYALAPSEYAEYFFLKGYGITPDEALRVGETHLQVAREQMKAVAKDIVPSGDPADAVRVMKKDHPTDFKEVLNEYRATVSKARQFVIAKNLLTLPADDELIVIETPEFMRPLCAFAQGFEPGRFDERKTGIFMVTPTGDDEGLLAEHNRSAIVSTVTHETYLGRHAQGICAMRNPSYIRLLCNSPDFGEGWGMYAEDVMLEAGFNDTPLGRLVNVHDLIYRIARLIAEIKLTKGFMTLRTAAAMFEKECWLDARAAMVEATTCAMMPTYFSAYLLGKLAIYQLREEVEAVLGDRFTLKFFHDSLAYAGCMPMPFMRRAIAIRMKEHYGVELPPTRENLFQYAMRKARENRY